MGTSDCHDSGGALLRRPNKKSDYAELVTRALVARAYPLWRPDDAEALDGVDARHEAAHEGSTMARCCDILLVATGG